MKKSASTKIKNSLFPFLFKKKNQKRRRKKKTHSFFSILFFCLILLPFFLLLHQNCGPQFPAPLFNGRKTQSSVFIPPFAYDVKIDTLSFMSCADIPQSHIGDTFHHFKVGSYTNKGGVRFTKEFLNETKGMKEEEVVAALQDTDLFNARLRLQLSLRHSSQLQKNVASVNSDIQEGENFQNFFVPLDRKDVVKELLKLEQDERMNIMNPLPLFQKERFLTGRLYFNSLNPKGTYQTVSGGQILNFYKGKLQSSELLLALTYARFIDDKYKLQAVPFFENFDEYANHVISKKERAELGEFLDEEESEEIVSVFGSEEIIDPSKVQGTGFLLSFRDGGSLMTAGGEQYGYNVFDEYRVLSRVKEVNLKTGQSTEKAWDCQSFIVIQSRDNTQNFEEEDEDEEETQPDNIDSLIDNQFGVYPLCPEGREDPQSSDPAYRALRSVLNKESWSINMKYRCVVPKTSYDLCYFPDKAFQRPDSAKVNYFGLRCGRDMEKWDCPHYVSVCYSRETYASP